MSNFSQKSVGFVLSLLIGLFSFSVLSSSVLASAVETPAVVQTMEIETEDESFLSWFFGPVSGLLASVEDPFGTGADKIKPDAARDGDLQTSFIGIINYLLLFLGLVLLVIIIYAGVLIILSDGEEDAVTKGRKMIMYALIGVVIIVLSYTIVNFITDVATAGGE